MKGKGGENLGEKSTDKKPYLRVLGEELIGKE